MSVPRSTHRVRRFAGNYLSTLAFIGLSWWIVSDLSEFHRSILQAQWRFGMFELDAVLTVRTLFLFLMGLYAVVLVPFYLKYPWLHSKAFVFLQGAWFSLLRLSRPVSRARQARVARNPMRLPMEAGLSPAAKQAALALLLKFFFAPLMINWCLGHAGDLGNSLVAAWNGIRQGMSGRVLFDSSLFWACFQLILFVDTLLFTLGYIVETPALRNRIRSVDPTFFGWAVCLACYPPFNEFTGRFLQWQSSDFPQFQNDALHFLANISVLGALTVYSWASVALAFKASNLTNRGIIGHGPYALVRHPAYAAKNLAWWIGAIPNLYAIFASGNLRYGAYALLCLCGWTLIYVLRAITEERHLLMGGNGYDEYARRVPWRFIPRVV
jgi:protein-S-isoprenylcysteine O-methyltransferase Ste14